MGAWFNRGRRRRLAPPRRDPAWWEVLGCDGETAPSLEHVEARFRRLAASAHPDRGGSTAQMQRLLAARAQARRQLGR